MQRNRVYRQCLFLDSPELPHLDPVVPALPALLTALDSGGKRGSTDRWKHKIVWDSAAKLHTKALIPAPQLSFVLTALVFPKSRQVVPFPGSPYIPYPQEGAEDASPKPSPGPYHSTSPGAQAG